MTIHARVIEDRGHLGIKGGQIEVIEQDADEPWRFEMGAAEIRRQQYCVISIC